jgi:hypothetical protein
MQNLKLQIKIKIFCFLAVIFSFFFSVFNFCQATILYLEPPQGEYHSGDTFIVEIRIDTEGECINVVEANLSFSKDILEAVDFSQGESILTLWVKTPTIEKNRGEISFIGGIPVNYCGRIPGDPGPSNLLGKIIFKVPGLVVSETKEGMAELKFLDSSQVLLSDKLGTKAKLTTRGAAFKILSEPGILKDEWREAMGRDNIQPEPFEIEIHQDPLILEGKYFIIFSTTDKQTGIDHYEILETRLQSFHRLLPLFGGPLNKRQEIWKRGESPYLLEDQSLKSIIKVKAVDKTGNERIAEYLPSVKPKLFPYWIIILILVGTIVTYWIITKPKRSIPKNI